MQFEMIDWPLHGAILMRVGRGYRPSILKMIWDENPCMMKLHRDGRRENGQCPLCGDGDGPGHFVECSWMNRLEEYEKIVGNFRSRLRCRNTSPLIATWLIAVVCGGRPVLEQEGRYASN